MAKYKSRTLRVELTDSGAAMAASLCVEAAQSLDQAAEVPVGSSNVEVGPRLGDDPLRLLMVTTDADVSIGRPIAVRLKAGECFLWAERFGPPIAWPPGGAKLRVTNRDKKPANLSFCVMQGAAPGDEAATSVEPRDADEGEAADHFVEPSKMVPDEETEEESDADPAGEPSAEAAPPAKPTG